jgi:hypothetical protein
MRPRARFLDPPTALLRVFKCGFDMPALMLWPAQLCKPSLVIDSCQGPRRALAGSRASQYQRRAIQPAVGAKGGGVVGGRIVVEGEPLEEGTRVTVVDDSDEEPYELTPEQESALLEADAEADRGEVVSAEQLFAELRRARA